MPFLWRQIKKLLSFQKSPSPKHRKSFVHSKVFIERVSLLISSCSKVNAGMTVEAAIVLPLFLFFFINLGCVIEMIRLHGNLELALWDTGNRVCVYGYVLGDTGESGSREGGGEGWKGLLGDVFSYTYVKSEIVNYVGESYLENSPLAGGTSGLQFWESSIPMSDGTVDVIMTYQVAPRLNIPAVRPFRMQNRYYGHLWTGYDISGGSGERETDTDVVYVAENGVVYHESQDCTHLKLSVREVTLAEALSSKNEYGSRYQECAKCKNTPHTDKVLIAKEGDCYHYAKNCSGLKRTVYTITRQQAVEKYRPCSRCAK